MKSYVRKQSCPNPQGYYNPSVQRIKEMIVQKKRKSFSKTNSMSNLNQVFKYVPNKEKNYRCTSPHPHFVKGKESSDGLSEEEKIKMFQGRRKYSLSNVPQPRKLMRKMKMEAHILKSELRKEKQFGKRLIQENLKFREDLNSISCKKDQLELRQNDMEKKIFDMKQRFNQSNEKNKKLSNINKTLAEKFQELKKDPTCLPLKKSRSDGNLESLERNGLRDNVDYSLVLNFISDNVCKVRDDHYKVKKMFLKQSNNYLEELHSIGEVFLKDIGKFVCKTSNSNVGEMKYAEIQKRVIQDLGLLDFYDTQTKPCKEGVIYFKNRLLWEKSYVVISMFDNTISFYISKKKLDLKERYSLHDCVLKEFKKKKSFSLTFPLRGEILFKTEKKGEFRQYVGFISNLLLFHKYRKNKMNLNEK